MKGLKYNLKCAIPSPAGSMRPTQCRRKSLGSRIFSRLDLWGHERSTDEECTQVSRNRGLCHFPRDCRGLPGIRVRTEAWNCRKSGSGWSRWLWPRLRAGWPSQPHWPSQPGAERLSSGPMGGTRQTEESRAKHAISSDGEALIICTAVRTSPSRLMPTPGRATALRLPGDSQAQREKRGGRTFWAMTALSQGPGLTSNDRGPGSKTHPAPVSLWQGPCFSNCQLEMKVTPPPRATERKHLANGEGLWGHCCHNSLIENFIFRGSHCRFPSHRMKLKLRAIKLFDQVTLYTEEVSVSDVGERTSPTPAPVL